MRTGLKFLSSLMGGAIAGLTSVHWVMGAPGVDGWEDSQAGLSDANPYVLARTMLNGELPLPQPALRRFVLSRDADGLRLDGDCDYVVEGRLPPANWWSFAAGEAAEMRPMPAILTPDRAVYEQDGGLRITISRRPQTGNWISPGHEEPMTLSFVLAAHDGNAPTAPDFAVKKGKCR